MWHLRGGGAPTSHHFTGAKRQTQKFSHFCSTKRKRCVFFFLVPRDEGEQFAGGRLRSCLSLFSLTFSTAVELGSLGYLIRNLTEAPASPIVLRPTIFMSQKNTKRGWARGTWSGRLLNFVRADLWKE